MSIASEITRIAGLRDTIRSKLIDFEIITDTSAKLSACSEAIDGISETTLTTSDITITPTVSVNITSGVITVSGNGSGTVSASKGYSKGMSNSISATASGTGQITVYDGTITTS